MDQLPLGNVTSGGLQPGYFLGCKLCDQAHIQATPDGGQVLASKEEKSL